MIRTSLSGLQLVDRVEFLLRACAGQRVLHLGATDAPGTVAALRNGRFLHSRLLEVVASLVGMDNNKAMIDFLRNEFGIDDIRFGEIEEASNYPGDNFDVVVVGEILEHLSNPGQALDALRARVGHGKMLIVTVPNAYSLKAFLRAIAGHELIHPDHVLHHSLHTLCGLLTRHGFNVTQIFSFVAGGSGWAATLTNQVLRVFPQLAEGIGVVCHSVDEGLFPPGAQ